jgi:hypothetical protein
MLKHPDFITDIVVPETAQLLVSEDLDGEDSALTMIEGQSLEKEAHPAIYQLGEGIDINTRYHSRAYACMLYKYKEIYGERVEYETQTRKTAIRLRDSYPGTKGCTTFFGAGRFAPPLRPPAAEHRMCIFAGRPAHGDPIDACRLFPLRPPFDYSPALSIFSASNAHSLNVFSPSPLFVP